MIKFYDGTVDERPTLRTSVSGGFVYAHQMNKDGSVDAICYDDLEYGKEVREADVIVDATDFDYDLEERREAFERIGKSAIVANIGDIVEIFKGKKFPIGKQVVVKNKARWYVPNAYNKIWTDYIVFEEDGEEHKVDCGNAKIVDNVRIRQCRVDGLAY